MISSEEFTYQTFEGLDLKASFYKATHSVKNQVILYFHGGGLIYGMRHDLPEVYKEMFLENGYHLITFDYPLSPETSLPDIYQCAKNAVKWFIENSEELFHIPEGNFILFGRSAGAYLTLLLARDKDLPTPQKVISFYGYDSLLYEEFNKPNPHYLKFPSIPDAIVKRMIGTKPIAVGPLQTRYALYLYARQKNKWSEFLGVNKQMAEEYSLTEDELHALPPVFLAQSDTDQDVPYRISQKLKKEIPHNYFYGVTGMEHDFDRDTDSAQSIQAYRDLIEWLNL